jgi:hypothetical protein
MLEAPVASSPSVRVVRSWLRSSSSAAVSPPPHASYRRVAQLSAPKQPSRSAGM